MGLLLSLSALASLLVGMYGYALCRRDVPVPEDLAIALESGKTRVRAVGGLIDRLGIHLAPTVLRIMGRERIAKVRETLDRAGHPGGLTVERYAARRAVFTMLGGLYALLYIDTSSMLSLLICAGSIVLGWYWVDLRVRVARWRRQAEIEKTLPDFLDVLTVTVSAGMGFRQALARVAEHHTGPMAEEIHVTLRQLELGMSRRQAFEKLRERNDSEQLGTFVTALLQAEELGAPLGEALMQLATDMRREAGQEARRRAARTVPRVSLVVTMLLVPATVIMLAAALFLGSGINLKSLTEG